MLIMVVGMMMMMKKKMIMILLLLLLGRDRFGEEPLHSCEVMLHDLETSKRINQSIRDYDCQQHQRQQVGV